ncbi:hypothetical protein AOQ84DRAFT_354313 [Glonium stellatum]|uniref:Uncharacterized protein n=1 Tax=Glonium stellatum TaxID=574774 RepID=A0A8E2F1L3_9PEZI|nr:hypothetical protein AOQ84DRAFT_354313 [Glonium stellatum]
MPVVEGISKPQPSNPSRPANPTTLPLPLLLSIISVTPITSKQTYSAPLPLLPAACTSVLSSNSTSSNWRSS